MNTEKKLEYFTEAINKEVESKKRNARHEMAASFEAEVSKAVAQTQAETDAQVNAQKQAIKRAGNIRINEAETEARRSLSTLTERLTAQLFDAVKTDIINFTKSPQYETYLIETVRSILTKFPYKYIQLSSQDTHLEGAIKDATGLTVEFTEECIIGGFRLLSENRSKITEHTIQARLTQARQEFSAKLLYEGDLAT